MKTTVRSSFTLNLRWLLALAALITTAAWGQAGYIHEMSGTVSIQRGAGAPTAARPGDTFEQGTTFDTAGNGRVVIKFADGQLATLGSNSTFRVEQFNYNARNMNQSSSSMSLLKGALRYVTGLIGTNNRAGIRLSAATATIGIRGTDVIVNIDPVTLAVQAAVNAGLVALQTNFGTANIGVNQFVSFSPGQAPSAPAPLASAPAIVQAVTNSLRAQPLPINTPVVVLSAARAAVATAVALQAQAAAAANPTNAALQAAATAANQAATAAFATAVADANTALAAAVAAGATVPAPPTGTVTGTPAPTGVVTVTPTGITITPVPTPPPTTCTTSPC